MAEQWPKRELKETDCPAERTITIGNTDFRLTCDIPLYNHRGTDPHMAPEDVDKRLGKIINHRCVLTDMAIVLWDFEKVEME